MSRYREFTDDVEAVARYCRNCGIAPDPWLPIGNPGSEGGQAQGFWVTLKYRRGFAKPSKPEPDKFRAANEKIASDLAFELMLPVPPVVLWRRETRETELEPCVAVSLVPFFPPHKWAVVRQNAPAAQRIIGVLGGTASAMLAFDTWVDNRDRKNEGNVLLSEMTLVRRVDKGNQNRTDESAKRDEPEESARERITRVAYIDYAYSLSYAWKDGHNFKLMSPAPLYPDGVVLDLASTEQAINEIEQIGEDIIRSIIHNVPDEFLDPARKSITYEGLLFRRERLWQVLVNEQEAQGEQ